MLIKRMSARDARANFSDLLGVVYYTKEPVIVEKKGKPVAVVISLEEYERLQKEEEKDWALIDRMAERNKDKDPDEVLRDITTAVEKVRQERYGQKKVKATKGRR